MIAPVSPVPPARSAAHAPTPGPSHAPVRLTARVRGGHLIVSGPELDLEIGLAPLGLRFLGPDGEDVLADNPRTSTGSGARSSRLSGSSAGVWRHRSSPRPSNSSATERLYGLGEKFTRLDKVGRRIVSWTQDAFGSTSERSHKNVPFLWSTPRLGASARYRRPHRLGPGRRFDAILDGGRGAGPRRLYHRRPRAGEILAAIPTSRAAPPFRRNGRSDYGCHRAARIATKRIKTRRRRAGNAPARRRRPCRSLVDAVAQILRLPLGPPRLPRPGGLIAGLHSSRPEALSMGASLYLRRERAVRAGEGKGYFVRRPDGESTSSITGCPSPPGRTASSAPRGRRIPGTRPSPSSTSPIPRPGRGSRTCIGRCCARAWTFSRRTSARTFRQTRVSMTDGQARNPQPLSPAL